MRASWLPQVLRDAGLTVIEVPGWKGRGREMAGVKAVVCHDTVTSTAWTDSAVVKLLRDGRPGVPGPLSQLGQDRSGRFHLIADGRSNHNVGLHGNNAIGIETFANGGGSPKEPWNAVQRRNGAIAAAAILNHLGLPVSRCLGHKETDPRRKQDPYGVDMGAVRKAVAALMLTPEPEDWLTMATEDEVRAIVRHEIRQGLRDELGPKGNLAADLIRRMWGFSRRRGERDMASLQASGGLRYDELSSPHEHDHAKVLHDLREQK